MHSTDMITSIKFHIGGYFAGHTEIMIKRSEDGALVVQDEMKSLAMQEEPDMFSITDAKWQDIIDALYIEKV